MPLVQLWLTWLLVVFISCVLSLLPNMSHWIRTRHFLDLRLLGNPCRPDDSKQQQCDHFGLLLEMVVIIVHKRNMTLPGQGRSNSAYESLVGFV